MNTSLYLTIAGLHFKISAPSAADIRFLKKKYRAYHVRPQSKIAAHVILQPHRLKKPKLTRLRGNAFALGFASLTKDFQNINYSLKRVVAYALLRNNGLALHASSLVEGKKAYIFIGQKGAGKSTIRRLGEPRVSLGDDIALVRKIGKSWYLFGSPLYMRTNRAYPNVRRKITGVCVLHQARLNALTSLSATEQLQALIENSFLSLTSQNEKEKTLMFASCAHLASAVPIAQFSFRKEKQALQLVPAYFPHLKRFALPLSQILSGVRPKLVATLPKNTQWKRGIADVTFLQRCQIIQEAGWHFEFNGERSLAKIGRLSVRKNFDSSHANLIRTCAKKGTRNNKWFVAIKKNHRYMLLDGNHSAAAVFLLPKKQQKRKIIYIVIDS